MIKMKYRLDTKPEYSKLEVRGGLGYADTVLLLALTVLEKGKFKYDYDPESKVFYRTVTRCDEPLIRSILERYFIVSEMAE